jgi:hypothetical protein
MEAKIHNEDATKLKIEPNGVTLNKKSTPSNKVKKFNTYCSLD